jgi:hypothetical protein
MRRALAVLGLALVGFGGWTMFHHTFDTKPAVTARWAVAGLLAHDLLLAPLTFAAGWLLLRVLPGRVRTALLPVLVLAGVSALLLVPKVRSPAPQQNPTVNAAPSTVNTVLAVLAGLAVLAVAQLVAAGLSARARRSSDRHAATAR